MLGVMGFGVGRAVDAQTDTTTQVPGTVEIHARSCDEVFTGNDWYTGCHESVAPDTYFEVTNADTGDVVSGITDATGTLVLELVPGTWSIAGPPGEFVTATSIYCATSDAGDENVDHPVTIEGGEAIVCDYYFVPEDLSGQVSEDLTVFVNLCVAPGCTELVEAIEPADGVVVGLTSVEDGSLIGTCTTGGAGEGTCLIPDVSVDTTSASVFVDPATVPEGFEFSPNPSVYEWIADNAELRLLLLPVSGELPIGTPVVEPTSEPIPLPEPVALVLPASLYAGTCDDLEASTSAEPLNDLTIVEGEARGSVNALEAASGYTLLPMSIVDLVDADHAVAVFSEDDPGTPIACGDIGGVLDREGTLTVGLAPVDDSGAAGVAYLASRGDSETGLSLFVVPEGLVPETLTPEASPTPRG
jgi:hypothetical protein